MSLYAISSELELILDAILEGEPIPPKPSRRLKRTSLALTPRLMTRQTITPG